MLNFFSAYAKLAPLYLFVIIGLIAGKMKVERHSIGSLLIFLITPITFFNIGINTSSQSHYLFLPILSFLLSVALCFLYLFISSKIWKDKIKNLLAFAAGASNNGYFGLPVVMVFFDQEVVGIYMLTIIGIAIYEYTIGAYVMARGNYSIKQSLNKVLKLPMVHAFILGLALNKLNFKVPPVMKSFFENTQGCYIVLGLMLIGISLSNLARLKIDWKFVWVLLSARFIVSPVITGILVFLDLKFWNFYSKEVNYAMLILSFMPPAVNTVVFATIHNNSYEEAAVSVILGIIMAMIIIPLLLF
ncbi:MAG: AEC family transporter [Candidatus Midichloria sp.]